jgi:putative glutamine amidotransferase
MARRGELAPDAATGSPPAATHERPLRVGLSARLMHQPPRGAGLRARTLQYLEQTIAHWLMAQGALVFMVPTLETGGGVTRNRLSMAAYVHELDGLVLQGGSDVSPQSYGETPLSPDWAGDRVRDLYEMDLFWETVIQRKPVLGVCRGAQLINVALGGTLYQDIATQVPGALRHVDRALFDGNHHEIAIEPGSALGALYPGLERASVTSIHHQAVKEPGNGLVVEARSPADGVVEAIRWTGSSHVVGLQWHPEFHSPAAEHLLDCSPILMEFFAKARARKLAAA